jgi:hypothetical protein
LPYDFLEYWQELERRRAHWEIDLISLEGKIFISQPETSPGGSPCPDLSFPRVSEYLEVSINRAELLGLCSLQEGTVQFRVSVF